MSQPFFSIVTPVFNGQKYIEETIKSVVDDTLTDREIDVLILITEECSTSEMAKKLDISIKTVESHRRSLYKKIKVKNVVGLVMYAVKNNIV